MTDTRKAESMGLWWFLGLFLAAAALRLAAAWYLGVPDASDTPSYTTVAQNLAKGAGYVGKSGAPYLHRPPTYPLFLAGLFYLFGPSLVAVQAVQSVLAGLVAPLIAHYTADTFQSPRAGKIAGSLWAVEPVALAVPAFILTEALGGFLLVALLIVTTRGFQRGSRALVGLGGALAAALALNTPITLLLFPGLVIVGLVTRGSIRRYGLGAAVAGILCFGLFYGAWPLRNYLVTGKPVAVRSIGFGSLVWRSTELEFRWLPTPYGDDYKRVQEKFTEITKKVPLEEQHSHFLSLAWDNFRKAPLTVAARIVRANFWFWVEVPGAMRLLKEKPLIRWPLTIAHNLLLLLCLGGLFGALRRSFRHALLPAYVLAYFALMLVPMMPIPRYYLPVLPVMTIFSGLAIGGLGSRGSG